jgi:hypothetical protein
MSTTIDVVAAQLAGGDACEDRIRTGRTAVVVLDGASGSGGVVSVDEYVDQLSAGLITRLDGEPEVPLPDALASSIAATAERLRLTPGQSPSATVSIIRRRADFVDLLVLGDSPMYVGPDGERFTDQRLAALDLPSRQEVLARLAGGSGYDSRVTELLQKMPGERTPHMNTPGGYWIAEATGVAGQKALTRTVLRVDTPWVAILTDGADDNIRFRGIPVPSLASATADELDKLLSELHDWEEYVDPGSRLMPRYKRHDDKTIVLARFL